MPRSAAGRAHVVDARWRACILARRSGESLRLSGQRLRLSGQCLRLHGQRLRCGAGEHGGRGRRAELIGDHAQRLAFARNPQDGEEEVLPPRRIDPAGAEDPVPRAARANRLFTFELACAIDVDRIRGIALRVRLGLGAVEDVIGGVVDEQRTEPPCFLGEDARRAGIDREGRFALALGAVHGGVGGRVDQDLGLQFAQRRADSLRVGEVEARVVECSHLAQRRERALKLPSELAVAAGEQDFHERTLRGGMRAGRLSAVVRVARAVLVTMCKRPM